jgi:hypothetical protein
VSSGPAFRLIPAAPPEPAPELSVVVGCHGFVCTIPVRYVDRLLRRDEVEVVPPRTRRGREPGVPLPQVLEAAGEAYVAWNLGTMLELPPVTTAWVLLRVPAPPLPGGVSDLPGAVVPLAVRTGTCLMVQPVQVSAPLPPGLFRARGAGITGAFATSALRGKRLEAAVGICLDPSRLWTPGELGSSRAALAAAAEDPGSWGG